MVSPRCGRGRSGRRAPSVCDRYRLHLGAIGFLSLGKHLIKKSQPIAAQDRRHLIPSKAALE